MFKLFISIVVMTYSFINIAKADVSISGFMQHIVGMGDEVDGGGIRGKDAVRDLDGEAGAQIQILEDALATFCHVEANLFNEAVHTSCVIRHPAAAKGQHAERGGRE